MNDAADSRRRVLLLIRTMSGAGAELVVQNLCSAIDRERFECMVCELMGHGERARALAADGFRVVSLNPEGRRLSPIRLLARLRKVVVRNRVEIIHSHSTDAMVAAALCGLTLSGMRHVHTFHFGNYPHHGSTHLRLERRFHRFADQLVAVGNRQADAIARTYGIDRRSLHVIWNGVRRRQAEIDHQLLEPYRKNGRLLIGTVGTLIPQKGHEDLLQVAACLKGQGFEMEFLVIGDGASRQMLESRARELGIEDRVHFLGWIPDAARRLLPAVDVFFQPSRWEAMSMVLLEAATAGLPIVCTDVGEASRVFDDGVSALIVAPGDVNAMASAIGRFATDAALRQRVGQAAAARVSERCGVDRMVSCYEAVYSRLLGARGG